jgi:hypothetical protein
MSGPKLVIKQQISPLKLGLWAVLTVILLLGCFFLGRYLAVDERQQLIAQTVWLQEKLDEYQQAYQEANESLVMQTQSSKVDDQSSQQLIDSIKQLRDTQMQLEAELQFYRNIMAPELSKEGLTIADFELLDSQSSDSSRFKLVLTQAGRQEQFIKGKVELKLEGLLNGEPKTFAFSELGTFQAKHFQFQFRYFQNIEGEIVLPQGFTAEQVTISARTQGLRKNQTTEKKVNWSS